MLRITPQHRQAMIEDALAGLPNEACGLIAGRLGAGSMEADTVEKVYPCRNVAGSAVIYTLDPLDHLRADRDAESHGWEIIGVYHSHTHTEGYPSPTDVAQAPDPVWHYVLVSLKDAEPVVRSYRIVDSLITEEDLAVLAPASDPASGPESSA